LNGSLLIKNKQINWGGASSAMALLFSLLLSLAMIGPAMASPTTIGQTGILNMPSARVDDDGALRFGLSQYAPYTTFWSSLGLFSRLELGARYTSIDNTVGLTINDNYGTFKDKAFDVKLLLVKEGEYLPAISIGSQDFLGTRVFDAQYVVLSKSAGTLDWSLGYGRNRIDGYFGGIEYHPAWAKGVGLLYEYDAIDYRHERFAVESGTIGYKGGSSFGIHYQSGWLGMTVAYQNGRDLGVNAYLSIPLMEKEFIPKLDEPPVFNEKSDRVAASQWLTDASHRQRLITALEMQGYKNVQVLLVDRQLDIGFSHPRISLVGRAVGRVARTALLLGPSDMTGIRLTYFTLTDLALVTYQFRNLALLEDFFVGKATYGELLSSMTVSYADPATARQLATVEIAASFDAIPSKSVTPSRPSTQFQWVPNEDGDAISLKAEDKTLGSFRIAPINAGIYFNDANGAFRYETFALAKYSRRLRQGLFLKSGVRLRLFEDVSQVVDKSNSTLPHVRSDVADYKRDADFKLDSLLLNQFFQLRPRVYARASAGYYEEMFGGVGGQILYLPKQGSWATDLSLDYVRQRDTDGDLGFRDYETTTAIAAVHYQIPQYGLTFTLRGGRFLAKDKGFRYEIQRRFRSGVRIGAWYTVTDGEDITKPGSPGDPYRDKGIFVSIPLGSMLTRDSRTTARFDISPWTRDVGQMVKSPGDLYTIMEDPLLLDWNGHHLLSDFHR
jgi:hypothetical protein